MSKSNVGKQKRIENFEILRISMAEKGFHEKKCTISIFKANLMVFITSVPIIAICAIIYSIKWDFTKLDTNYLLLATAIFASIPIHEILHGLTWSMFCKHKGKIFI